MRWCWLLLGLTACGGAPAASVDEDPATAVGETSTRDPGEADPLLSRARENLADGELEPGVRDQLLASGDPVHARARRILGAMDRGPAPPDEDSGTAIPIAPPVLPPGGEDGALPEVAAATPPAQGTGAKVESAEVAPPLTPAKPKRRVSKMTFAKKKYGAMLTLHSAASLAVGVASRRESGIIHLVVEASSADAKVLSSRPRITGARVTSVRKTGGSVFVTVELDSGWRLRKIRSFPGGARVELTNS